MTRKTNRSKRYRKKKKDMPKEQSQRWHFKYKLKERYGLFCNRFCYRQILTMVDIRPYFDDDIVWKSKSCIPLLQQSNARFVLKIFVPVEIFDKRSDIIVPIEDERVKIYAVYDMNRYEFCTALPWYRTDEELLEQLKNEHLYVRE